MRSSVVRRRRWCRATCRCCAGQADQSARCAGRRSKRWAERVASRFARASPRSPAVSARRVRKRRCRHLLELQGRTHASAASYNNLWGVPLSLARMPRDTQYGIFEIGMNHADEITPLTAQVRPHVAIVTMVAAVHLEHFDSVAGIADAKGEIFSGLEPGGVAVINGDLEWTRALEGPRERRRSRRARSRSAARRRAMCG